MELFQVDEAGKLFISPVITCWDTIEGHGVDVVIDLEGDIDHGVPTIPDRWIYVYYPIHDEDLPNLRKLRAIALMGAELVRQGHGVLSHCGMGFNRSALLAGMIMHELGMDGPEIVEQLRCRRPGALFNEVFADHLASLRR
ncbi:MAG: dual specificity protein phosphatase family protein [bacterium]|nr:dual specificity protein phosphatase family protein [bacterium]MBK7670840.1 dual specificity protein phosphatase family protein [bacterium]